MSNIKKMAALFFVGSLLLVCTSCGNNTADANSSVAESSEVVMDEKDKAANESAGTEMAELPAFTAESTVGEVLADPAFKDFGHKLTGRRDIPQAVAVIMQYTGYNDYSKADAPTYVCVGTNDGIGSWRTMQTRLEKLESLGVPTEFHSYDGLPHGFGLGTGTIAEVWLDDAIAFWETQIKN